MKNTLIAFLLLGGAAAFAQPSNSEIASAVFDDVKVVRRIADVARRDLPRDVVRKILDEDLDMLRGRIGDQQYRYARWERTESNRKEDRFTIQTAPDREDPTAVSMKGELPYRIRLQVPGRRMLLLSNRRVWFDRVDLNYVPVGESAMRSETIRVDAWLEPGDERFVEMPQIAREATMTVWARTDGGEKAAFDVAFYRATLVDDPDSPFATVVRRVKSADDAIDGRDYRRILNIADELMALLQTQAAPGSPSAGVAPTVSARPVTDDLYFELRLIEDLLVGSETERRDGLDRLHRLVERLRPSL